MGQQQVKALADRGKSARNIKSFTKKDAEKSEFHTASGKCTVSHTISEIASFLSEAFEVHILQTTVHSLEGFAVCEVCSGI